MLEPEIESTPPLDARTARVTVVAGEHDRAGAALHQRRAALVAQIHAHDTALDVVGVTAERGTVRAGNGAVDQGHVADVQVGFHVERGGGGALADLHVAAENAASRALQRALLDVGQPGAKVGGRKDGRAGPGLRQPDGRIGARQGDADGAAGDVEAAGGQHGHGEAARVAGDGPAGQRHAAHRAAVGGEIELPAVDGHVARGGQGVVRAVLQRAAEDRGAAAVTAGGRGERQQAAGRLDHAARAANRAAERLRAGIGQRQQAIIDDVAGHRAVLHEAVAQLQRGAADDGRATGIGVGWR